MRRVVTVTMNPAVDKTVFLDALRVGGLNRAGQIVLDAGGKGVNVSKTIRMLGGHSLAAGLLGEQGGDVITDCLDELGISHDFIRVKGRTRTNTKLAEADGSVTEVNEPGPRIAEGDVARLTARLEMLAGAETLFVFVGSVPPGVETDCYRRMIEAVHQKGAQALLDADGELFSQGVEALPEVVKPNREELTRHFGKTEQDAKADLSGEPERMGRALLKKGIATVLLSCGADGAVFLRKTPEREQVLRMPALQVPVLSTVGAGDAMTAAYCTAFQCVGKPFAEALCQVSTDGDFERMARFCMAVSAAAVTTKGTKPPSRSLVEELLKRI